MTLDPRQSVKAPQPKAQVETPKYESIMSRPRPVTRRFYLDRNDLEKLCGAKGLDRLRQKIPQTIVEAQRAAAAMGH